MNLYRSFHSEKVTKSEISKSEIWTALILPCPHPVLSRTGADLLQTLLKTNFVTQVLSFFWIVSTMFPKNVSLILSQTIPITLHK